MSDLQPSEQQLREAQDGLAIRGWKPSKSKSSPRDQRPSPGSAGTSRVGPVDRLRDQVGGGDLADYSDPAEMASICLMSSRVSTSPSSPVCCRNATRSLTDATATADRCASVRVLPTALASASAA